MKDFADDNLRFDENDGKFSKSVGNTKKRRNCSSPVPSTFFHSLFIRLEMQTCKH